MPKIIIVNLDKRNVVTQPHEPTDLNSVGRGLAVELAEQYGSDQPGAKQGCLVLAPGLLSGTPVPCTGRLSMVGRKWREPGLLIANTAGPIAQKLGSLDIAALVVQGSFQPESPVIVRLDSYGVEIVDAPELQDQPVSPTIEALRQRYGQRTAIVGVGPAGEHLLPLGSTFSTYPERGTPKYHVGRNRLGEVFGGLGLKAVAVSYERNLTAPAVDKDAVSQITKQIGRLIVDHPVCGGALPAYGSITLIKMLKHGQDFMKSLETEKQSEERPAFKPGLNRNCAVGCVVGCLNRHAASEEEAYSSPAESEVQAGCEHLFQIRDTAFARQLNSACFELGLDSLEFLASAAMLLQVEGREGTKEEIKALLQEVEQLSPRGRLVASATRGIAATYADKPELQKSVTKPSAQEADNFTVNLVHKADEYQELSDLQYLHAYMIAAENIGLCLFTTFAMLDQPNGQQLLAQAVQAKIGLEITVSNLIGAGLATLSKERAVAEQIFAQAQPDTIPEFVKVLYRYFQSCGTGGR